MTRDRSVVVVHLLLFRASELLLLRRAGTGYLDGLWVPPGGHRRRSETLRDAACRECLEETGFAPDAPEPVCVLGYATPDGRGLNFVFEAAAPGAARPEDADPVGPGLAEPCQAEPYLAEPECADAIGWFATAALPQPTPAWLAQALAMRGSRQWFAEPDP